MTPDLLNADRKSLFNACLKSASDGLIPDGREAALVVYFTRDGKMAQYLPMTYGIIKKIRNSGELGKIVLQMIFENDKFKYFIDEGGEKIVHEPNILGDRGQPKGVYAIIVTKDGNSYIEVMSADEVMQVQKASKAKNGPWQGDFKYEMWKKTVLRRLSKRVPMNSEVERVIQNEDEFIDFKMANENQDKGKQIEKLLEQKPEDEKTEQPVEEKEKTPFENFEGDVK